LGSTNFWCEGASNPDTSLYPSSPLDRLPGVGKKSLEVLIAGGFSTCGDLVDMSAETRRRLLSLKGIGAKSVSKWEEKLDEILPEEGATRIDDTVVDHRLEENPYWSKFGKEEGGRRWRNCSSMKKICCVTELVEHIVQASKKIFEGTDNEDNWYFYHDALTVMTAADTRAWMEEKGYLKHWLLPQLGLLKGTRYEHKLPGDSPELMPMDSTLNKDIDDSAKRHVAVTRHITDKNDHRKFSLATHA